MRKLMVLIIVLTICLSILFTVQAGAKQTTVVEKEQKPKLETFQLQTGAVVIKGYSNIGKLSAMGSVEVTAMEFSDIASSTKQVGIVIQVTASGRLENSDRSFIDYDEIDSLLKGIDYVSKATTEVTKLDDFEATYKTKGYFSATTFSSSDAVRVAVSSGYISPATAYLSLQQLQELRQILAKAKLKLDSVK